MHLTIGSDSALGQPIDAAGICDCRHIRQRLVIARVFLKNSPIVLLGEAACALDRECERARMLAAAGSGRAPSSVLVGESPLPKGVGPSDANVVSIIPHDDGRHPPWLDPPGPLAGRRRWTSRANHVSLLARLPAPLENPLSAKLDFTRPLESRTAAAPTVRRPIRLRYWLEYAALRSFDAFTRALPLEVAARFSGRLWGVIVPHLSRHRRADRHLAAMMPELSVAERRRILHAMWRNLGQTFLETLQIDRILAEPDRIELDASCREIMRRTVAEGGIVASAHMGNWELAAAPFAAAGGRGVYRPLSNPLVDAYLFKIREPFYKGGLLAKGDGAARGLASHARRGAPIGQMADLHNASGVRVPFFGRLAPSTPTPALLARRYDRPLFAVVLVRVATCRFQMQAVEIEVPHSDDRAADIREATAKIQSVFEGWIRRWPEQWTWAHSRYEFKNLAS